MAQRELTEKQRQLLDLDAAGASDEVIACTLGIHTGTVRAKRAAIRRGVRLGAYRGLPPLTATGDLFTAGEDAMP